MIRSRFTLLLCSLVSILVATSALAYTSAELVTWEQALHAEFNSIEADVLNCPNGECQARSEIEAAYASAETDRLGLVAARQSLGSCGTCGTLDANLATLAQLSGDIGQIITTWEEQH